MKVIGKAEHEDDTCSICYNCKSIVLFREKEIIETNKNFSISGSFIFIKCPECHYLQRLS